MSDKEKEEKEKKYVQCKCNKKALYISLMIVCSLLLSYIVGVVHMFNQTHMKISPNASYHGTAFITGFLDLFFVIIIIVVITVIAFGVYFFLEEPFDFEEV